MKNTTHTFWVTTERVQYLSKYMGEDKLTVHGDEMEGTTKITVEIENSADVLCIFHAGIMCGAGAFRM